MEQEGLVNADGLYLSQKQAITRLLAVINENTHDDIFFVGLPGVGKSHALSRLSPLGTITYTDIGSRQQGDSPPTVYTATPLTYFNESNNRRGGRGKSIKNVKMSGLTQEEASDFLSKLVGDKILSDNQILPYSLGIPHLISQIARCKSVDRAKEICALYLLQNGRMDRDRFDHRMFRGYLSMDIPEDVIELIKRGNITMPRSVADIEFNIAQRAAEANNSNAPLAVPIGLRNEANRPMYDLLFENSRVQEPIIEIIAMVTPEKLKIIKAQLGYDPRHLAGPRAKVFGSTERKTGIGITDVSGGEPETFLESRKVERILNAVTRGRFNPQDVFSQQSGRRVFCFATNEHSPSPGLLQNALMIETLFQQLSIPYFIQFKCSPAVSTASVYNSKSNEYRDYQLIEWY